MDPDLEFDPDFLEPIIGQAVIQIVDELSHYMNTHPTFILQEVHPGLNLELHAPDDHLIGANSDDEHEGPAFHPYAPPLVHHAFYAESEGGSSESEDSDNSAEPIEESDESVEEPDESDEPDGELDESTDPDSLNDPETPSSPVRSKELEKEEDDDHQSSGSTKSVERRHYTYVDVPTLIRDLEDIVKLHDKTHSQLCGSIPVFIKKFTTWWEYNRAWCVSELERIKLARIKPKHIETGRKTFDTFVSQWNRFVNKHDKTHILFMINTRKRKSRAPKALVKYAEQPSELDPNRLILHRLRNREVCWEVNRNRLLGWLTRPSTRWGITRSSKKLYSIAYEKRLATLLFFQTWVRCPNCDVMIEMRRIGALSGGLRWVQQNLIPLYEACKQSLLDQHPELKELKCEHVDCPAHKHGYLYYYPRSSLNFGMCKHIRR